MRQQLAAAFPDADPNDIEVELALQMDDLRTKGEEKWKKKEAKKKVIKKRLSKKAVT